MHQSRTLGLAFLLILLAGAATFLLMDRSDAPAPSPSPTAVDDRATPAPAVATEDGNAPDRVVEPATAERTAAASGLPAADGPAIVGRVVDDRGQPVAGVEVVCQPGMFFSGDFSSFDFGDSSMFAGMGPGGAGLDPRAWAAESVRFATDDDGRFRVNARGTSRTVGVRLMRRGYRLLDRNVRRPDTADVDVGTLTLERGAVVGGRVVDADGAPVVDASVTLVLPIERQFGGEFVFPQQASFDRARIGDGCRTDEDGRFELPCCPAGELSLRATHEAHPSARRDGLELVAGQELLDVRITMQRGAEIRGRALDLPEDRAGLVVMAAAVKQSNPATAGLMGVFAAAADLMGELGIQLGETQADLDADGAFALRGLRADRSYRIWLARVDARNPMSALGTCSARLEVSPGRDDVELRYDPGIVVTLTLVDDVTGAPVQRIWLEHGLRGSGGLGDLMAMQPGRNAPRLCPGGRLVVDDLRPKDGQKLALRVEAIGYETWRRADIELPPRGTVDLGVVRLSPRPVLQVQVVDDRSGQAVQGARVRIAEAGGQRRNPFERFASMAATEGPASTRTDRDGRCTVNLPAADATLSVDSDEHAPFSVAIPASTEPQQNRDVRLLIGGEAAITVVDEAGLPVAAAAVEHRTPDGGTDQRKADENGVVVFERLAPGSHGFRLAQGEGGLFGVAMREARRQSRGRAGRRGAEGGGEAGAAGQGEPTWQELAVVDGKSAALTLTKAIAAVLTGFVRENGVPVAGARVSFAGGPGSSGPDAMVEDLVGGVLSQFAGGGNLQATTDERGAYRFVDLPPGQHRLRVSHSDRAMTATVGVTLAQGDNSIDVDLDTSTLRGVVLDPDGNPVAGATVRVGAAPTANDPSAIGGDLAGSITQSMMPGLSLGGPTITTDDFGAFVLRGVAPDAQLRVRATANGFAPTAALATVARGEDKAGLELRLGRAGRIRVVVQNPSGFAMAIATFAGEDEDGAARAPVMQMLRKGKGTLDGLRPGRWKVRIGAMSRGGAEGDEGREVIVVAGETVQVDF